MKQPTDDVFGKDVFRKVVKYIEDNWPDNPEDIYSAGQEQEPELSPMEREEIRIENEMSENDRDMTITVSAYNDLMQKYNDALDTIDKLKNDVKFWCEKIELFVSEKKEYEKQINDLQSDKATLRKSNIEYVQQIVKYQRTVEELEEEAEQAGEWRHELACTIVKRDKEIEELKELRDMWIKTAEKYQNDINGYWNNKVKALEQENQELQHYKDNSVGRFRAIVWIKDKREAEIDELKKEIEELKSSAKSNDKELQNVLNEQYKRIDKLKSQLKEQQDESNIIKVEGWISHINEYYSGKESKYYKIIVETNASFGGYFTDELRLKPCILIQEKQRGK